MEIFLGKVFRRVPGEFDKMAEEGGALIIKKDFKMPVEEVPVLCFKIELK